MNKQSEATARWQQKKGIMPKTYKLKIEVVEAFAQACADNDKTQSEMLTELMQAYSENRVTIRKIKSEKQQPTTDKK